MEFSNDVELR